MNGRREFDNLLNKANEADTAEDVAEVLAIVDRHEGIVHRANEDGCRLLHWASGSGHVDLIRGLIDRGAEVSAKTSTGSDALMWASFNGHIPAVTLLLDHGADVNARDNDGLNALMFAAMYDKLEFAVFLLTRGFDLDATDNYGKTALDHYGTGGGINLTIEVKEQRREVLRSAFTKAKLDRTKGRVQQLEKENTILRRPAYVYAAMLFSEDFSDVTFEVVGGERIPAHRNILAASSECFSALLKGQWAESASGVVRMEQTATAVKALLRFLYTGEVDEAALVSDLGGVLELAALHGQDDLTAACEQHALQSLTVKSVAPCLVAAHLHKLATLKAACIELIKAEPLAVAMSKAYFQLEETQPALWLELRVALGLPANEEGDNEEVAEMAKKRQRVQKRQRVKK